MGRVVVDEAVFKTAVEGVATAISQMNKFEAAINSSLTKIQTVGRKGIDTTSFSNLNNINGELTGSLDTAGKAMTTMSKDADELDDSVNKLNKSNKVAKKGFKDLVVQGMFMSIGWQIINNAMLAGAGVIKDYFTASIKLEQNLKTMSIVAASTGRSYADILGVVNSQMDEFTDKSVLMDGVLRLLSTGLSTDEINQYITAIKEGSAAMGVDFNEQLALQARGFKQLTANILDNIGVTVYLDDVKRKASKTYGVTIEQLTEDQIHRQLLNEIIAQTTKYEGAWEAQLGTTAGAIARVKTEYNLLMQEVSDTTFMKNASTKLADLLSDLREYAVTLETIRKYDENLETTQKLGAFVSGNYIPPTPILEEQESEESFYTMYANRKKEVDIIIDSLIEYKKIVGETYAQDVIYTKELDNAARILSTTPAMIEKEIAARTTSNVTIEESISKQDILSNRLSKMIEYKKDERREYYLTTEEGKSYNNMLQEQNNLYNETNTMLFSLNGQLTNNKNEIQKLTYGTVEWEGATLKVGYGLKNLQKDLQYATDQYNDYNSQLSDSTSKISSLTRELDRLKSAMGKEEDTDSATRLKEVKKELEKATKDQITAEDNLLKRVEPRIFQEYKAAASDAKSEIARLTAEQSRLEINVQSEIDRVTEELSREYDTQQTLIESVETWKTKQDELTGKIEDTQTALNTLNTTNFFLEEKIKTETEKLKPIETEIDTIQSKINKLAEGVTIPIQTVSRYSYLDNIGQGYSSKYGAGTNTSNTTTNTNTITFGAGSIVIDAKNQNVGEIEDKIERWIKSKISGVV